MNKAYWMYHCRWQLSTPILYFVIDWVGPGIWGTIVANFIGACIFFFVDKRIFKKG